MKEFVKRSRIEATAEEVFGWHARDGALERLAPPWEAVRVLERTGGIADPGSRTTLEMRVAGVPRQWIAEHTAYEEGRMFRDEQVAGPFARWVHTHRVEADGPTACFLEDRVEYALPLGAAGSAVAGGYVRRVLERTFAYRHRITAQDLAAHKRMAGPPLRVLVSGSRGLVGSALVPYLTSGGNTVARLVRPGIGSSTSASLGEEIVWNPVGAGVANPTALEGFDAVVHLAGENIAGGRWTAEKKARIRESRITGTRLLVESLARLSRPPRVLVAASAIGFYGDRGEESVVETSGRGAGFLAEVCAEWEAAAEVALRGTGIRVVHLRIGVVLSPASGALGKMLLPFRLGAGGVVGNGKQWMSWIALDDLLDVFLRALRDDRLTGPLNAVAPHAVTNAEWTQALGRVLRRPTIFPMPAFAARAAFGEMAQELLLSSTRVLPERLLAARHVFRFGEVEGALRHMLGRM
jgi:uncharacterized protein (TIGR01777 family)